MDQLYLDELTHVNFAFAYFHPDTYEFKPMQQYPQSMFSDFTAMKKRKPSLKTWVSLGGWVFNNKGHKPDTHTAFSDLAASPPKRAAFISSLRSFMEKYGFDGVDIDWEYPGLPSRGGRPDDTPNLATLLREMRSNFGGDFGISLALPPSRVSLLHFDVKSMENTVDWYNVMTYNLHSPLDEPEDDGGSYLRPQANLTEVDERLGLLWRAGISPKKVVLGLGWHGRVYRVKDPGCKTPGCPSVAGTVGGEGDCTHTPGSLSKTEIKRIIDEFKITPGFDQDAAVNWLSYASDKWVSYDSDKALELKTEYAAGLCLKGTMVWCKSWLDVASSFRVRQR